MRILRLLAALALLGSGARWSRAGEISPISLTLFGVAGEPVQPYPFANSTSDAWGFNFLAEWNASPAASFGLGYEQAAFYGPVGFTAASFNFEARCFPLQMDKPYAPYFYGGVGFNPFTSSPNNYPGTWHLKLGIGDKVHLGGPISADIGIGCHWMGPDQYYFQYLDVRWGLSLALGGPKENKPTPAPSITPQATPTPATVSMKSFIGATPEPTAEVPVVEAPTPTPEISQAPVTTLAQVKKYYKLGMKAFMARNYPLAYQLLKKSIAAKEIHKASYYYAETYATIGVIYQFHAMKIKDHDQKALMYYKKALAIDPHTKSARHYYYKLKAKVARETAKKKRSAPSPTPTPSDTPAL